MEDIDKHIDWFERSGKTVYFQFQTTLARARFCEINDRISNVCFYIKNNFPEYAERLIYLKKYIGIIFWIYQRINVWKTIRIN